MVKMKETYAQRQARLDAEDRLRVEKWEAEKPLRLLKALARANALGVEAFMHNLHDNILYYSFDFGGCNYYNDPYLDLGESNMCCIETELDVIEATQTKDRRLKAVRQGLLERLSDEEKEALGL
jgi:hypothetical protein